MSRAMCQRCNRPETNCICPLFLTITNDIKVLILQHPSEANQTKGSVTLLSHSLKSCQVIQGEVFNDNTLYQTYIQNADDQVALLYPSEFALETQEIANTDNGNRIKTLVLLDGTWKKAYRLYMMNPALQHLRHIKLPDNLPSLYDARITKKKGGLSTLEAACHALSQLEDNAIKYQPLLERFKQFNEQLLAYRQ